MLKKTTLSIILTILASALVAVAIWYFVFSPAPRQDSPTQQRSPSSSPTASRSDEKLRQISAVTVISASLDASQNKVQWYDAVGRLWSGNLDGSDVKFSKQAPIQNLIKSYWSPDKLKSIVATGADSKDIRFVFLNSLSGVSSFLRNNIKTIAFSPDSKKIVYQVVDDAKSLNTLFVSDPEGKNQKTIVNLRLRDVSLAWPQTNLVSFASIPTGLAGGSLWVLNLKTLIFDRLIDSLNGLEILWSPGGDKILFSYTDAAGKNPRLKIMDLRGNIKDLGAATIVKKCAWSPDDLEVYCAVPQDWPGDAVLPDDYFKDIFFTTDEIWKFNAANGMRSLIASPQMGVFEIFAAKNKGELVFISKNDRRIYRAELESRK